MGIQFCKAFGFPFRLTVADAEQDDDRQQPGEMIEPLHPVLAVLHLEGPRQARQVGGEELDLVEAK